LRNQRQLVFHLYYRNSIFTDFGNIEPLKIYKRLWFGAKSEVSHITENEKHINKEKFQ
jgi:hypothetical protein